MSYSVYLHKKNSEHSFFDIDITYNYYDYIEEATDGDERFAYKNYENKKCYGIRGLYGKTAFQAIPMLIDAIVRLYNKYNFYGCESSERYDEWDTRDVYEQNAGNVLKVLATLLRVSADYARSDDYVWDGD